MKKILMVCFVALWAIGSVPALATEESGPSGARFTVQHHDIAVDLLGPELDESSTAEHPMITGCHVTVLISDRHEMVSPPQCHWDGKNESTRYTYTLYYRLKGSNSDTITSYSINLLNFTSIARAEDRSLDVRAMGVKPEDGIVYFRTASMDDILDSVSPTTLARN